MQANIAESEKASAVKAVFVGPACKVCGSTSVRRSRRNWLDRLATAFGYYPYRCRECRSRFHLAVSTRPTVERHRPRNHSGSRARRRTTLRRELLIYALALVFFAALVVFFLRDRY